jgi:hypothetical protein
MNDGPDPGTVIVAIFLILFGVCIALVGGGCTVFLIGNPGDLFRNDGGLGIFLLLLSLAALAIGIFMVRGAIRLLGRRDG